jgi:hypothetical protein
VISIAAGAGLFILFDTIRNRKNNNHIDPADSAQDEQTQQPYSH